jgi:ribosome recycling factor
MQIAKGILESTNPLKPSNDGSIMEIKPRPIESGGHKIQVTQV